MYRTCCRCGGQISDDDTCPACQRGFCDDCLVSEDHDCMAQVDIDPSTSNLPFGWSKRRHGLALLHSVIMAILFSLITKFSPVGVVLGSVGGLIVGYLRVMFPKYAPSVG